VNGDFKSEIHPRDAYQTDAYHLEKYVAPGFYAIAALLLLPIYLFGGTRIGGWDLATLIVFGLVVGHLVESLRLYRWGRAVDKNFSEFNGRVDGLLVASGIGNQIRLWEKAQIIVFTLISPYEKSEFTWNLVRWQKMIVLGQLSLLASAEWLVCATLAIGEHHGWNPLANDFRLAIFKPTLSFWWSVGAETVFAVIMFVIAVAMRRSGLDRQRRNNESLFQIIFRHRDAIVKALNEDTKGKGA
jgi:hypothetical protein